MKRTARAFTLLLAAVALLLAPAGPKENGWPRLTGSAAGMGAEPGQLPGAQIEGGTPAEIQARSDAGNATSDQDQDDSGAPQALGQETEVPAEASPVRDQPMEAQSALPAEPLVAQATPQPWRERPKESETASPPARDEDGKGASKPWRPSEKAPATADRAQEPRTSPPADGQGSGQAEASRSQPVRLFQTAAFRGNFKALPKWKRVLAKAEAQVRALNTCTTGKGCPPGATSWQRIMAQARGLAPMEQLKTVNAFFNKWPYRLDQDIYGTSDWWATPQEFLKLSGDCEDYAITKYYALRELGHSPDNLRIVVLQDRIRGIAHAILVVLLDGDAYVLDNVTSVVFSHSKYSHYVPYYSLNENYRWSHIPVDKKP